MRKNATCGFAFTTFHWRELDRVSTLTNQCTQLRDSSAGKSCCLQLVSSVTSGEETLMALEQGGPELLVDRSIGAHGSYSVLGWRRQHWGERYQEAVGCE